MITRNWGKNTGNRLLCTMYSNTNLILYKMCKLFESYNNTILKMMKEFNILLKFVKGFGKLNENMQMCFTESF